jgi:DNA-binding NarL/FixJ family response regulator
LTDAIRVLVADDHAIVRQGLRTFLDLQPDITVVGEAEDGAQAVELARSLSPDVVVMDLVMPRLDGIAATKSLRDEAPGVKVVALSSFSDRDHVLPALDSGASGYLTKETRPEELADTIRKVHGGEPVLCTEATRHLLDRVSGAGERPEGTVTVLFTDIEASTKLVESLGDTRAREVFRDHDRLVREALEEAGGSEVEQEGDSFMLAFAGARPAVSCAVAAQRAIAASDLPLRIRAGLNTGEVIAEEHGYFGRAVFVAARVAGQAQGGQILVSEVTRNLVGEHDVEFRDHGEHELRGLAGTHRLYEVAWGEGD